MSQQLSHDEGGTKQQFVRIPGQGRIYKRGAVWYVGYWVDGRRKQERTVVSKRGVIMGAFSRPHKKASAMIGDTKQKVKKKFL